MNVVKWLCIKKPAFKKVQYQIYNLYEIERYAAIWWNKLFDFNTKPNIE